VSYDKCTPSARCPDWFGANVLLHSQRSEVCVIHIGHPEIVSGTCGIRTIFLIRILFADLRQAQEKNGSSGRTRTYNPPVNSCANGRTANCCLLRLSLKIRALDGFEELRSAADFERESLKKSPKCFMPDRPDAFRNPGPSFVCTGEPSPASGSRW
jgi:hypothetical protein